VSELQSTVGIGSLLSERSARTTFPELRNFRSARIGGYQRKFGKVGVILIREGLANWDTVEVASCAAFPAPDHELQVTLFEIDSRETPAFYERENLFRIVPVQAEPLDGSASCEALLCAAFSDAEYRERCGSEAEYQRRVGQYYDGLLWRDDILPCRAYLQHCVAAATSLGPEQLAHFLDHSYLADGRTTIRQYYAAHPDRAGQPGANVFERYRG